MKPKHYVWITIGGALLLLAILLTVLLWPRYYYTDGFTIRQARAEASLRIVLWEDPTRFDSGIDGLSDTIEPVVSPDGQTLVFVSGRAKQNTELMIATRSSIAEPWSDPLPITTLNTEFDELGPTFTDDGETLYYYSDRPGGSGGYDLWTSSRSSNGVWTTARNLGPKVNTHYNEYDPAIQPGSDRIFFSSNRARPGEAEADPRAWQGTLRELVHQHDYDIYSTRAGSNTTFSPARSVPLLNSPKDDGQVAFTPRGDFLYFSSNRRGGEGGFDLFRSHILHGEMADPEPLAPPVNSPRDEMDPTLWMEGHSLVYSSNRESEDLTSFSLFETTTREVVLEKEQASLDALAAFLGKIWRPLLWLLLSLLALLFFLRYFINPELRGKVPLWGRCLLGSGMLHLLLLFLLSLRTLTVIIIEEATSPVVEIALDDSAFAAEKLALELREQVTELPRTRVEIPTRQPVETIEFSEAIPLPPSPAPSLTPAPPVEVVYEMTPFESQAVDTPTEPPPSIDLAQALPAIDVHAAMASLELPMPEVAMENDPAMKQARTDLDVTPQDQPSPQASDAPETATADTELARVDIDVALDSTPLPAPSEMPAMAALEFPAMEISSDLPAMPFQMPTDSPQMETPEQQNREQSTDVAKLFKKTSEQITVNDAQGQNPQLDTVDLELSLKATNVVADLPREAESAPSKPTTATSLDLATSLPQFEAVLEGFEMERLETVHTNAAIDLSRLADFLRSRTTLNTADTAQATETAQAKISIATAASLPSANVLDAVETAESSDAGSTKTHVEVSSQLPPTQVPELATLPLQMESASDQTTQASATLAKVSASTQSTAPTAHASTISPATTTAESTQSTATIATFNPLSSPLPEVTQLEHATTSTPESRIPPSDTALPALDSLPRIPASEITLDAPASQTTEPSKQLAAIGTSTSSRATSETPTPLSSSTASASTSTAPAAPMQKSAASAVATTGNLSERPSTHQPSLRAAASANADTFPAMDLPAFEVSLDAAPAVPIPTTNPTGPALTRIAAARSSAPISMIPAAGKPVLLQGAVDSADLHADVAALEDIALISGLPIGGPAMELSLDLPDMAAGPTLVLEDQPLNKRVYALRKPERRETMLEQLGGNQDTEAAIGRALDFLVASQSEDGHWDIKTYGGKVGHDAGATGMALLCFMGWGAKHTEDGPYRQVMERAIDYLLSVTKENGDFRGKGGNMYDQGIVGIALAEAYALTKDERLKPLIQNMVEFIGKAQNKHDGGWRYTPGEKGDTSVVGWQVMALKSAAMGGIPVPKSTWDGAVKWFDKVGGGKAHGLYGYTDRNPKPALVAEGMFCQQLMKLDAAHPRQKEAAKYLGQRMVNQRNLDFYFVYYGSLALYQHQGPLWEEWNTHMKDTLLETQETKGKVAGSWKPRGQHGKQMGRIVCTTMAVLSLEVYYRYLPMYTGVSEAASGK